MISSLVNIILNFVISLVNIILLPIDNFISSNIPSLSSLLTTINDFIDFIISNISYAINLTLLPNFVIIIVVDYIIFKVTVPYLVYFIKLAIKWYNNLKT